MSHAELRDTRYHAGQYGPFMLVTIAVFLALEAILLAAARRQRQRGLINTRLRVLEQRHDRQISADELRRNRDLTLDGEYPLPLIAFNRLLLQSGVRMSIQFLLLMSVHRLRRRTCRFHSQQPIVRALSAGSTGVGLPDPKFDGLAGRRQKRFESQLPEAIDVIVRSLGPATRFRSQSPWSRAKCRIPMGTEFGMVADEMTYGLDLAVGDGELARPCRAVRCRVSLSSPYRSRERPVATSRRL